MPHETVIDFKDGTPDPLAFVKFFELADVGLTAEDLPRREKLNAKGTRLKAVRKESPFAHKLLPGDVVTGIDEKRVTTRETFRKLLRRKLAEGGPLLTFTVRRSGRKLQVPIAIKD